MTLHPSGLLEGFDRQLHSAVHWLLTEPTYDDPQLDLEFVTALGTEIFPSLIYSPLTTYIISCVPIVSGALGFIYPASQVIWKWKVKCRWK